MDTLHDAITVSDAAEKIGITVPAVHHHIRLGRLRVLFRSERLILLSRSEVGRFRAPGRGRGPRRKRKVGKK